MTRAVPLLLLPLVAVAVAAPVPKQTEAQKIEAKFGKIVDPKGDSTFALDGDKLTITMPAEEERVFGFGDVRKGEKKKKFDLTPMVEFDHTGDFALTVRVASSFSADAKPVSNGTLVPYSGGGIRITGKDSEWYRFGVCYGGKKHGVLFPADGPNVWSSGMNGMSAPSLTGESNWLRLIREGSVLHFKASTDGKKWVALGKMGGPEAEGVSVALFAHHTSDTKHAVTFDEFKIETPKK